ncbi:MED7-domain-containing protein [Lichtheimia hyalospora FSU 10163]|nr:MED7-domain-containing protein [Lichtheimia hyalospora FSU 10163]
MNEAQSNASAWPDPPFLYKRYTAENLDKLHRAKKTGAFPDTPISQPLYPDFPLKALEPPSPPSESYTIFDQRWQVHEKLKKLNRSLMTQYLQLLQTLVENPQEYGQKIENISTIFINMHHILNEYRPHQARETLRLLMENQISKKKEMAAELRK